MILCAIAIIGIAVAVFMVIRTDNATKLSSEVESDNNAADTVETNEAAYLDGKYNISFDEFVQRYERNVEEAVTYYNKNIANIIDPASISYSVNEGSCLMLVNGDSLDGYYGELFSEVSANGEIPNSIILSFKSDTDCNIYGTCCRVAFVKTVCGDEYDMDYLFPICDAGTGTITVGDIQFDVSFEPTEYLEENPIAGVNLTSLSANEK